MKKKTRSVQYARRWRPVGNRWRLVCNRWRLVCNRWRLVGNRWRLVCNRWRLVCNRWRLVGSHQTSESGCHSRKKKGVSVLMAPPDAPRSRFYSPLPWMFHVFSRWQGSGGPRGTHTAPEGCAHLRAPSSATSGCGLEGYSHACRTWDGIHSNCTIAQETVATAHGLTTREGRGGGGWW